MVSSEEAMGDPRSFSQVDLLRNSRGWFGASGDPASYGGLGALLLAPPMPTTTLSGNQLPASAPPFGGVITDLDQECQVALTP
jgi:hypothetical protein